MQDVFTHYAADGAGMNEIATSPVPLCLLVVGMHARMHCRIYDSWRVWQDPSPTCAPAVVQSSLWYFPRATI